MTQKRLVYIDHNATTPPSLDVRQGVPAALEAWGNPSSIHWSSREPKAYIREARQKIAQSLNVHPLELIFTSGGSEGNNTVLQSVWEEKSQLGKTEIIISTIEHPSVEKCAQYLESRGAVVHRISVDILGNWNWQQFDQVLSAEKTAIVSVMFANNETGLLLPIAEIIKRAHAKNVPVHSDCVQALGKVPLNLKDLGVDYATFSAHKFYALKGCGIIFARKGQSLSPLIYGGGQERHRRGGTENTLGIYAMSIACDKLSWVERESLRMRSLRDRFENEVVEKIGGITINHQKAERLSNTSSLLVEGVDGETMLMSLDIKGYAVSTGAACSSGNPEPSPVLLAIGLTREQAQTSLRVSFGWGNTDEHVDEFVEVLSQVVKRLRELSKDTTKNGKTDYAV